MVDSNPVEQPATGVSRRISILIVEDEELFAKAVIKRLTKAGYQCRHASTLERAVTQCKEALPDLILLMARL